MIKNELERQFKIMKIHEQELERRYDYKMNKKLSEFQTETYNIVKRIADDIDRAHFFNRETDVRYLFEGDLQELYVEIEDKIDEINELMYELERIHDQVKDYLPVEDE